EHPVGDLVTHELRHGITGVGPVQGDGADAVLDGADQVVANTVVAVAHRSPRSGSLGLLGLLRLFRPKSGQDRTTSASAATTPFGPASSGLMSNSATWPERSTAKCWIFMRVSISALRSAAGCPRNPSSMAAPASSSSMAAASRVVKGGTRNVTSL